MQMNLELYGVILSFKYDMNCLNLSNLPTMKSKRLCCSKWWLLIAVLDIKQLILNVNEVILTC